MQGERESRKVKNPSLASPRHCVRILNPGLNYLVVLVGAVLIPGRGEECVRIGFRWLWDSWALFTSTRCDVIKIDVCGDINISYIQMTL